MNKFMHGTPLLMGDNTIPGLEVPEEIKKLIPDIFKACRDFGLDFYDTVIQFLTYDEISEIAAYGGFPVRYPHWTFGMEYEELQRGYEHGMHRIYEMVVNTIPCYIYCLDSNTVVDNVTVIAHALGHNDFFKNNVFFSPTSQNMMNQLANHGTRIREYRSRWGKEKVTEFIDHVLRINTLIDFSKAWDRKEIKERVLRDSRTYKHPERLPIEDGHEYMDRYINKDQWIRKQQDKIVEEEIAEELGLFREPTKDIMGFIRDNAPLKPWQTDIVAMLYQEAMYFAPQRQTKMLNEGWASFIDHTIMVRQGLVGLGQKSHDCGIVEYAKHKMGVLGGKYSVNPYKIGFCLFLDIEERWNKGRFGFDYDNCEDRQRKLNWDENLGLGKQKIFEVRKHHNDFTAILEFFTPEFCHKHKFFKWERKPNGDVVLENRKFKEIKMGLLKKYMNGGLPEIELLDPDHCGKGYMFLQHKFQGMTLLENYVRPVMQSLYFLWKRDVILATKNEDEEEIVYICSGSNDNDVICVSREEYEKEL